MTFDKVFSTLMDWEDVYMSQIPFRTGTFDLAAVTLLESEINNLEKLLAEKRDNWIIGLKKDQPVGKKSDPMRLAPWNRNRVS